MPLLFNKSMVLYGTFCISFIFSSNYFIVCLTSVVSQYKQGFKRLKKVQLEGRCGALLSSDWCRTNESNYKFIPSTRYKDVPDCSSRERFARGSNIPISIKYKTLVNEEAISRQREQQIKDRLQLELGKTMREPPPIEIGSKRIKVRPVIPRDRGGWS